MDKNSVLGILDEWGPVTSLEDEMSGDSEAESYDSKTKGCLATKGEVQDSEVIISCSSQGDFLKMTRVGQVMGFDGNSLQSYGKHSPKYKPEGK